MIANLENPETSLTGKQEKELELLLEEWKESRVSIARFDTISVDLRKYGFSLTTFLITAYSIVFQFTDLNNPLPVVVAPFAIMILVCGLFLADRYNEVLLLSSVLRCRQLEDTSHEIFEKYVQSNYYLRLSLTTFIENRVQTAKARPFSLAIYFLFILACLSLGFVFLIAYTQQTNIPASLIYWAILVIQAAISITFVIVVNLNMAGLIASILDEVIIDDRIVIKKLFSEAKIKQSIKELANLIHYAYPGKSFTILTIGLGGLHFSQRVIGELKRLGRTNIPSIALFAERIRVQSVSDEPNKDPQFVIKIEPPEEHLIADRDIIILDDLVSTGYTLQRAVQLCHEHHAKTVRTCILLNATTKRKVTDVQINSHGLATSETGNFVGCGMDLHGECRDLPYIGIAKSYNASRIK